MVLNHFLGSSEKTFRCMKSYKLWARLLQTTSPKTYRAQNILLVKTPVKFFKRYKVNKKIEIDNKPVIIEKLLSKLYEDESTFSNLHESRVSLSRNLEKKCKDILANLNENDKKKLEVIQLEHDFYYYSGESVPSAKEMTSIRWVTAFEIPTSSKRLKYYERLIRQKEFYEKHQQIKEENRISRESEPKKLYEHGRLFFRIYNTQMNRLYNNKLALSLKFGIPLVVDMDYTDHMDYFTRAKLVKDIEIMFQANKKDPKTPFCLNFTNCKEENPTYLLMKKHMFYSPENVLINVTEKSFTDMYPRDSLVYLSPNAVKPLLKFDKEKVHVLGGFADCSTQLKLSYARAQHLNIDCYRLPIDEYIMWNKGPKSLELSLMVKILMTMKNDGTWIEAFQNLPEFNIREFKKTL